MEQEVLEVRDQRVHHRNETQEDLLQILIAMKFLLLYTIDMHSQTNG